MADRIVQLTAGDFEDAMDFMNLVFSVHHPIDFERLLPKLYKPTDEHMSMNYAVKRDGRIRAVVGLYPIELRAGEATLTVAGIGGVSSHPRDRGQGHMKRLMHHCLEIMRTEGYDLSWLGGQRQRYAYFGYEICGTTWEYAVSRANLRHCYPNTPAIRFERVVDPGDDRIRAVAQWHERGALRCARPIESFHETAVSWHHELMVALDSSETPVGYLIVDPGEGVVVELAGSSPELTAQLVPAWAATANRQAVRFEAPPLPAPLVAELGATAEYARVQPSGNWQVFSWDRVLSALLEVRRTTSGLAPGETTIAIDGYGSLRLAVSRDGVVCERTDREPELRVDPATAMRMLFGPLPPHAAGAVPDALASWCPLPLHMPRPDGV